MQSQKKANMSMSESESEVAAEAESERYRVGYALQPKKIESFLKPSLFDYAKQNGIDLVQIDPTTPIHEQGPFHCIIHKLHTPHWNKHLQQFSAKSPNTVIIDPPELVDRLHNRVSMLDAVTHLQIQNATVRVPNQVLVSEPKAFDFDFDFDLMGLRFPVIAKPLVADGAAGSHELRLVFDREGLRALSVPTVLQEFVNHGGVVFKIYVAGQRVNCVKRESLADISEERLTMLKGALPLSRVSEGGAVENAEMPPQSVVGELARSLREALGLHLFNVDVIRDGKEPNRYLVIDINYFPGYAKMPSYEPFITGFLLDILRTKTA